MEPVCFNTGNNHFMIVLFGVCIRFNGAGVFQHRKLCHEESDEDFAKSASMEPVCFNTGNLEYGEDIGNPLKLQWSRCVSTPETTDIEQHTNTRIKASMEPVCFNTGNLSPR